MANGLTLYNEKNFKVGDMLLITCYTSLKHSNQLGPHTEFIIGEVIYFNDKEIELEIDCFESLTLSYNDIIRVDVLKNDKLEENLGADDLFNNFSLYNKKYDFHEKGETKKFKLSSNMIENYLKYNETSESKDEDAIHLLAFIAISGMISIVSFLYFISVLIHWSFTWDNLPFYSFWLLSIPTLYLMFDQRYNEEKLNDIYMSIAPENYGHFYRLYECIETIENKETIIKFPYPSIKFNSLNIQSIMGEKYDEEMCLSEKLNNKNAKSLTNYAVVKSNATTVKNKIDINEKRNILNKEFQQSNLLANKTQIKKLNTIQKEMNESVKKEEEFIYLKTKELEKIKI